MAIEFAFTPSPVHFAYRLDEHVHFRRACTGWPTFVDPESARTLDCQPCLDILVEELVGAPGPTRKSDTP